MQNLRKLKACLLQKLFLNAEFCFPFYGLHKNCPHQRCRFFFFYNFFWESFVFCRIFPFPSPKIHSTWADVNLIVLNMALTPPQSFNFESQRYGLANQNQRKIWRAVVQRVKICLGEEGLYPASFNQCTTVLIIRINDLDFWLSIKELFFQCNSLFLLNSWFRYH